MTDVQKELFSRYQDCVGEYQAMAEYLLFQNSFRLGERIMLMIMNEEFITINIRNIAVNAGICIFVVYC